MLVSTGLLVQSAMAGLVADAPTETLRTGCLARERERARSTGNGLTYLARDTDARLCEMRALPARILMRRPAYSLAVKPDLRYFRTQIIHEVLIIIGFSAQLPQPPRGLAGMRRPQVDGRTMASVRTDGNAVQVVLAAAGRLLTLPTEMACPAAAISPGMRLSIPRLRGGFHAGEVLPTAQRMWPSRRISSS